LSKIWRYIKYVRKVFRPKWRFIKSIPVAAVVVGHVGLKPRVEGHGEDEGGQRQRQNVVATGANVTYDSNLKRFSTKKLALFLKTNVLHKLTAF
jgi:hypothetical protein